MSKLSIAATLLLILFNSVTLADNRHSSDGLVIRDVTVVSPERSAPLEHAYVRIRNGRIAEVSTRPSSAENEINGTGRFLIPGLIDSHVHLNGVPGMRPDQAAAHPEIAAAALAQIPRSFLYFGFTTVIDLIGQADRIAEWNRADIRPDARFCGGAPVANGYPMVFLPVDKRFRVFEYFLYDERQRDRIPASVDPARHTPEAVVARMAKDGAICVKSFYETGFGSLHDLPTPTLKTMRALVAAAHARHLPVLIHANSKAAQTFAVAAGVDIIAHGLWNGTSMENDRLDADTRHLLQAILDGQFGYQPTMQVLHGEVDLFDESYLENPLLAVVEPASLIAWYGTAEAGWFRDQVAESLGGRDAAPIYSPLLSRLDRVVKVLADGDARLLFGTDTPSAPTYANPPGLNGWFEMQRWVHAGVSEEQLFRALTIANAKAFGLQDQLGTVEKNKIAHLLLLRENPLEDVAAYNTIETVILAGRPVEREDLSALHASTGSQD